MTDWQVVPYEAARHENTCVYLWLKGYAHTWRRRAEGAHEKRSDTERAYWEAHVPVVERMLAVCETRVAVDGTDPDIIYGFACCGPGDFVHFLSIKRDACALGFGPELVRDLLGDRLERVQLVTHDIPCMLPSSRARAKAAREGREDRPPPSGVSMPDELWERADVYVDMAQLLRALVPASASPHRGVR